MTIQAPLMALKIPPNIMKVHKRKIKAPTMPQRMPWPALLSAA